MIFKSPAQKVKYFGRFKKLRSKYAIQKNLNLTNKDSRMMHK